MRNLVSQAFTPRRVAQLEPRIAAIALLTTMHTAATASSGTAPSTAYAMAVIFDAALNARLPLHISPLPNRSQEDYRSSYLKPDIDLKQNHYPGSLASCRRRLGAAGARECPATRIGAEEPVKARPKHVPPGLDATVGLVLWEDLRPTLRVARS